VYVVERGGIEVARIGPAGTTRATVRDLKSLVAGDSRPEQEFARGVEAVVTRHNTRRVRRNPWER